MLPADAPTSNISQQCEPDDEEQMRQPQLQQEGGLSGEAPFFFSSPQQQRLQLLLERKQPQLPRGPAQTNLEISPTPSLFTARLASYIN